MSLVRIKMFYIVLIWGVFECSCKSSKFAEPGKIDSKTWSQLKIPNNLDSIGTLFGVTKEGDFVRIPTIVEIEKRSSATHLATLTKTKNLSLREVFNYMDIPTPDTNTGISLNFTRKMLYDFSVKNAVYTVSHGNLFQAFNNKEAEIATNIEMLELEDQNVYMVFETISAKDVHISLNKATSSDFNFFTNIKSAADISSKNQIKVEGNNSLIFSQNDPIIVFFQLRKINIHKIKVKGKEEYKLTLSLGEVAGDVSIPE